MKKIIIITLTLISGVLLQAQEKNTKVIIKNIGNLEIELDFKTNSIAVQNDGNIVLEEGCTSMCDLYIATTYRVRYSGYD